ncbi:MAG: hypothetical protein QM791_06145 [Ferruginibacter sp.]
MTKAKAAPAVAEEIIPEPKADLRKFNKAEEQVTKALEALGSITKIGSAEDLTTVTDNLKKAKEVENAIEKKRTEMVKPFNDVVKKINTYAKELAGKLPPAINKGRDLIIAYNKELQEQLEKKRKEERGSLLNALGMALHNNGYGEPSHYTYETIDVFIYQLAALDDRQWPPFYEEISRQVNEIKSVQLKGLEMDRDLTEAFGTETEKQEISEKIEALKAPVSAPALAPVATGGFSGGGSNGIKGITKTWTYEIENASLVPAEYLVVDEAKVKKAIAEGARTIPGIKIFQKDGFAIR